jgi:two-component system chemotaxis response regulator CheB
MVSTLTQKGTMTTLRALELGAVDFVAKPKGDIQSSMKKLAGELIPKLKAAARINMRAGSRPRQPSAGPATPPTGGYASEQMAIAIGASTGGVVALRSVLCGLPANAPPILITQHMPPKYTLSLATRLDQICAATVVEAKYGQQAEPGHVYIAPGGQHLELQRSQGRYLCKVYAGPAVSGHCPSVDVLFSSFAENAGNQAVGVILTGMGRDGAVGLLQMHRAGAMTFGQNESTCVVYGMPRAASELGAVRSELPLDNLAPAILQACARSCLRRQRAS